MNWHGAGIVIDRQTRDMEDGKRTLIDVRLDFCKYLSQRLAACGSVIQASRICAMRRGRLSKCFMHATT